MSNFLIHLQESQIYCNYSLDYREFFYRLQNNMDQNFQIDTWKSKFGKEYTARNTFKTKEEFQNMIRKIPEKSSWNLDNFELTFRENLRNTMQEIISRARPKLPQDAMNWLYCILNGVTQKSHITEQVQPHLAANSTWQYIRRWLLSKGVRDNPKTPY